jgi:hypothetical protein
MGPLNKIILRPSLLHFKLRHYRKMSYCRFSSMNWRCDVYVYQDVAGVWVTQAAGRRRIFAPIPDLPLMRLPRFGGTSNHETRRMDYPSRWHALGARIVFGFAAFWHNRIHMASLRLIPLRQITLPFAGETFVEDNPSDCADLLELLRSAGYVVPQDAIDELREEAVAASRHAAENITGKG